MRTGSFAWATDRFFKMRASSNNTAVPDALSSAPGKEQARLVAEVIAMGSENHDVVFQDRITAWNRAQHVHQRTRPTPARPLHV